MLDFEIAKNKTHFLTGIDKVAQLERWLDDNHDIRGVAVAGRSNVGKSSLINALFGEKIARISKTPGRTQQINVFTFELRSTGPHSDWKSPTFHLLDLPGYGHAEVSKDMRRLWDRLIGGFFSALPPDVCILSIQDARHPDQDIDRAFYDYIRPSNHEAYLLFNKMDKLKTQKERHALTQRQPELFKTYKRMKQIHFVSAEKGMGIPGLTSSILSFLLRPTH